MIRSQETGRNGAGGRPFPHEDGGGLDVDDHRCRPAAPPSTVPQPDLAAAGLALALWLLYAVTFDTGFLASHVASSGMFFHELFHDGRHLLGVPCH